MITAEEILETLPKLLKEKPSLKLQLYSILSEEYVTKNEILEYFKKSDEQWNKRFEQEKEEWNKKFEKEKEEWNKKFEKEKEEWNKKIEEERKERKESEAKANQRFENIERDIKEIKATLGKMERKIIEMRSALASMGHRIGEKQEDLILSIFKKELEWRNIDVNQVRHLVITDDDGELFNVKNAPVEIDMYLHNGLHILFEIKHFFSDKEDIYYFYRKAIFVDKKLGIDSKKVIIGVEISKKIYSLAESLGIEIITGESSAEE